MRKKIYFSLILCGLVVLLFNINKIFKNRDYVVIDSPYKENLHNFTEYKGEGVKIGILDTGIDYNHGDLNVKGGVSVDGNKDDYIDENGHGTNVAGVIGGLNRNKNIYGIAPKSELYSIKALDRNGDGSNKEIIEGVKWAIYHNIDILNMSISSNLYSKDVYNILKEADKAGIFVVAPAGNSGYSSKSNISYPAKFHTVMSVGSVNKQLQRSFFSNVGKELDIMAPGEDVLTTGINNDYTKESGTSIAAPYISGTAAVLLSIDPGLTNKDIETILKSSASRLGKKYEYGKGLVNLNRAIKLTLLRTQNRELYNFFINKQYVLKKDLYIK